MPAVQHAALLCSSGHHAITTPPEADGLTVREEPLGGGAFRKASCMLGRACQASACGVGKLVSRRALRMTLVAGVLVEISDLLTAGAI